MGQHEKLIASFGTTSWLVGKFGQGLSHEDSIVTPSFRANSFNWVIGHILVGRDRALSLLGKKPVLTMDERALYETGSEALNPEAAVRLDYLLEAIGKSQKRLEEGLASITVEQLAAIYDEERKQTVGDRLNGLHWHETYHVGQLEILRQVSSEREAFP